MVRVVPVHWEIKRRASSGNVCCRHPSLRCAEVCEVFYNISVSAVTGITAVITIAVLLLVRHRSSKQNRRRVLQALRTALRFAM